MILIYMTQLMKHCEEILTFNAKALSGDLVDLRNVHTSSRMLDGTFEDLFCIWNPCS